MNDCLGLDLFYDAIELALFGNVNLFQMEPWSLKRNRQVFQPSSAQIIQTHDGMAFPQQAIYRVTANEPRRAGYNDDHAFCPWLTQSPKARAAVSARPWTRWFGRGDPPHCAPA